MLSSLWQPGEPGPRSAKAAPWLTPGNGKWAAAQQELFTGAAINSPALRGDLQTPQLPFLPAGPSIWGKHCEPRVQVMPGSADH